MTNRGYVTCSGVAVGVCPHNKDDRILGLGFRVWGVYWGPPILGNYRLGFRTYDL